jgi:uncharacterized protein YecE (DUF72 family)
MSTHSTDTRVGTCGFAEARQRSFDEFDILEVQHSFYQPPRVSTARRWREKAPRGFVFTVKAWQLLTHEASSPTYRRLKEDIGNGALERAGSLKWNAVTRMAYERTQEIAEALKAEAILFQMPRSFTPSRENLRRAHRFFEAIDRGGRRIGFEPRGDAWDDDTVRRLVDDLDLVHVVDPLLRRPVGRGLRYFRLHGRPAYHYRYRYTDEDLEQIEAVLNKTWLNWVLFNNDAMAEDARRLMARLRARARRGCR